jgi:hypothetical protein
MQSARDEHAGAEPLPRWWRLLMIAAATIVFCSCARQENRARGAEPPRATGARDSDTGAVTISDYRITATDHNDDGPFELPSPDFFSASPDGLPEAAYRGTARWYEENGLPWEPLPPGAPPLPYMIMGPWTPPGFGNPWP